MSETVYNLYLMWADGVCGTVRYVSHDVDLKDHEALKFLQNRVPMDLHSSKEFLLANPFTVEEYNARMRLSHGHQLYDEVFIFLCAGQQPLSIVTPVVNGIPQIQFKVEFGDPNIYLREDMTDGVKMEDWLLKYMDGHNFRTTDLINDDYFLAIKLTYNAKHYVSAMKLLLSAIDSLAYIEYGDVNGKQSIFEKWLATYADLEALSITPQELWELRNGLLHMSNLHSRQVNRKTVRQISFAIGARPFFESDGIHYFSFHGLIMAVAAALGKWLETYNAEPKKMVQFVDRYDKTISDSRLAIYNAKGQAKS